MPYVESEMRAVVTDQVPVFWLERKPARQHVLVALLVVAINASSDTVFPGGLAALGNRDHVIDGQLMVIKRFAAVLALIQVTQIQVATAETNRTLVLHVFFRDG